MYEISIRDKYGISKLRGEGDHERSKAKPGTVAHTLERQRLNYCYEFKASLSYIARSSWKMCYKKGQWL